MRIQWTFLAPLVLSMTSLTFGDDPIVPGPMLPVPEASAAPMVHTPATTIVSEPAPSMSYSPAPMPMATNSGCACQSGGAQFGSMTYSSSHWSGNATVGPPRTEYLTPGHGYTGLARTSGMHVRHPYYSYRHTWFSNGPASQQVTIVW